MKTFFDLTSEFSKENSRVVIVPVPFEATTSYGKGTAMGPEAIFNASCQVELYDDELDCEPYLIGITSIPALSTKGSVEEVFKNIESAVASIRKKGQLPVVLGGEHSVTPPAVKGAIGCDKDITVVQFDAHADLREEYEGSKNSHACAMARAREMTNTVQIGIRSLSSPEAELIKKEKPPVFFARQIHKDPEWIAKVIDSIKTKKVYITIDIDVFDPSIMPSTGTPEPGGLDWYQVTQVLREIMKRKETIGLDIVELAPEEGRHAPDFMTAKLLYKCIGYWKEGQGL